MYKKGEADICRNYREFGDNLPNDVVLLPHSCDEWVIGGKEEVEMMIADLQELLKQL